MLEVIGFLHKSFLDGKYPFFILKDMEGKYKKFQPTEKSKPFADKLKPGDKIRVQYVWNSAENGRGDWNTYVNALKVEKVG